MAENLTIARPYAQAVFEIAKENNAFDQWTRSLESLAYAFSNEQFIKIIDSSTTNENAIDNVLVLLGDLLDEKGKNFVRVLAENDRFAVIPEIYQEFVRLRDDYQKVKAVELISARPLAPEDEKTLISKLEAKYQAKVNVKRTIDPSILGGVIIKVGDEVIDASIKTSLGSLSSTLK